MERALKFKYNENYSTCDELLARSTLSSLKKIRGIRTIAIEILEFINKESLQCIHDLVRNNKYNFKYNNTGHIPTVKTTRYGLNSFIYTSSVLQKLKLAVRPL